MVWGAVGIVPGMVFGTVTLAPGRNVSVAAMFVMSRWPGSNEIDTRLLNESSNVKVCVPFGDETFRVAVTVWPFAVVPTTVVEPTPMRSIENSEKSPLSVALSENKDPESGWADFTAG